MEPIRLEEIIKFTLGKNSTRIKAQGKDLYTPDDFEKDLYSINEKGAVSECIVSLIRSKMAPISPVTSEKVITSNFLKCEFDSSVLDKWYLCYQFNSGKELAQQITMFNQGITLSVKRLNIQIIGNLTMSTPDMKKQKLIGELYRNSLVQHRLMMQQTEDIHNLTLGLIRRIEED